MTDFKPILISELTILEKNERHNKNVHKARAYTKVLQQIKAFEGPITSAAQVMELPGVGKSIASKVAEIIETGALKEAEDIQQGSTFNIREELLNVFGIGPVKANELVTLGIRSLDELRARQAELLNDKQTIGLHHYDALLERIPRAEMRRHEAKIKKMVHEVDPRFVFEIVGSYRRGAADSGDIDVLLKLPDEAGRSKGEAVEVFVRLCRYLEAMTYVVDVLAQGDKKFMGVCRVSPKAKARRLDILLTTEEEYPHALLYFTGSDKFNIALRSRALDRGLTMNEHGIKYMNPSINDAILPKMKEEADILNYLGLRYVPPVERQNDAIFQKYSIPK